MFAEEAVNEDGGDSILNEKFLWNILQSVSKLGT